MELVTYLINQIAEFQVSVKWADLIVDNNSFPARSSTCKSFLQQREKIP